MSSFKERAATLPVVYHLTYMKHDGGQYYYFLKINRLKEKQFLKISKGNEPFKLSDFGDVLASGAGEAPEALRAEMAKRYNIIDSD